MNIKNIDKSTSTELDFENGFYVLQFQNDGFETVNQQKAIKKNYIQLHFCVKGSGKFLFNNNAYSFDILENRCILLYNPERELPLNLNLNPKSIVISLLISIEKFHNLFSSDASNIPFLSEENQHKKYYDDSEYKPTVGFVLQQILNANVNSSYQKLYVKGKIYELLSIHFAKAEGDSGEYCPYLVDEQHVLKIRKAKQIMIDRMAEPPSLQDLANEVGLNIKKLKEVFKQIYGDTVYGFLLNYKLEIAKKLLESNQYNVNEVGTQIGYSTSSHFIAAFRKKYGITPKKYIQNLVSN